MSSYYAPKPLALLFVLALAVLRAAQADSLTVAGANNPDLSLSYRVVNAWSTGFQAEVIISNVGNSSVSGWTLGFDLAARIDNIWGASIISHEGGRYEFEPVPWSLTVPAGGQVTLGFVAADGTSELAQVVLLDPASPLPGEDDTAGTGSDEPELTVTSPPAYIGHGPSLDPIFNYGTALQMGWYFYEAQRSGPLPEFDGDLPFYDPRTGQKLHDGFLANRIPWRGVSDVVDGAYLGLDLTGGWHDAGDHVKFGLPMAFSASFLAWGVLEFEEALRATGQLQRAKDNLRWVADYFIRVHVAPNVLYGQVGEGAVDHSIWGAPEVMPHFRPAGRIDPDAPGPDLAAQTAAAMTAISLVFREDEPVYAGVLLQRAIELYDFAQATRTEDESLGRYSDSIVDAQNYYLSRAGAKDDLPFAAAWLYLATKEPRFLHDAEADYTRIAGREGHQGWTAVWDDVRYGVYVLMAKIYSDPAYANDSLITAEERHDGYFDYNLHAQNFLNHWLSDGGVPRTPGGMAWLTSWGSARYNTMTAFLALVYRKHLLGQQIAPQLQEDYLKFATEQVNYVLGDNPLGMSYLVGYGDNHSQVAHHRASHGSTVNDIHDPVVPRHVLYGGLAGGPASDDSYTDDRSAFVMTEVATDMNAGITGVFAGLVDAYGVAGNEPDPDFPPPAEPINELYVRATLRTQQPTDLATGVRVTVVNESAYPPRASDGLYFRYFVDLSELFAAGFTLEDVILETYWDEGAGVRLERWQDSAYVFYVEGSFEGTLITPLGRDKKQKNIEFIIRLPWAERGWEPGNDPSYEGLVPGTPVVTDRIVLYDANLPGGAQRVWGVEPDPGILQSELPPPEDDPGASSTGSFSADTNVYDSWAEGYCVKFAITNIGSVQAQPGGIRFGLASGTEITNSWNGTVSRTGEDVDVTLPAWIGLMQPGQTRTDFGYCAAGTARPASVEVY
ncbi:MAG: glycoside hydrolase family 9 [Gammaproteobacteria bacterium]|nr:glycoside hydrolase family 9 [Gammaproteobacteria bacterium]NIX11408.1 glycoside hydrolase family 9 [Gammaproteobacteria bacterium]